MIEKQFLLVPRSATTVVMVNLLMVTVTMVTVTWLPYLAPGFVLERERVNACVIYSSKSMRDVRVNKFLVFYR